MHFVMYTDKSVAQAMRAINERLHAPGTKARPQLDGWVEKNGRFAIGVTTTVHGRFPRKTFLHGQAEREGGVTIIRGSVPGGLPRDKQLLIYGSLIALAVLFLVYVGNAIVAIFAIASGAALSIPLQGDFDNSEYLLTELRKALKARLTPPKT